MTKDSKISLIAGAALFVAAASSLAGAFTGWISFADQPDGMAAQLYTSDFGTADQQRDVLASNVPSPVHQIP